MWLGASSLYGVGTVSYTGSVRLFISVFLNPRCITSQYIPTPKYKSSCIQKKPCSFHSYYRWMERKLTCKVIASSAFASGAPIAWLVPSWVPGWLEASEPRTRPPAGLFLQFKERRDVHLLVSSSIQCHPEQCRFGICHIVSKDQHYVKQYPIWCIQFDKLQSNTWLPGHCIQSLVEVNIPASLIILKLGIKLLAGRIMG